MENGPVWNVAPYAPKKAQKPVTVEVAIKTRNAWICLICAVLIVILTIASVLVILGLA